jgi:hypothetical protein
MTEAGRCGCITRITGGCCAPEAEATSFRFRHLQTTAREREAQDPSASRSAAVQQRQRTTRFAWHFDH